MEREGTAPKRPLAQSFIIKRPRLTKLLDESGARIILLVAPAGYGKTTLAREWLSKREGVLWYSGRPAMADVAALAAGLVNAVATNDDARDKALELVHILATRGQSPEVLAKAVGSSLPTGASTLVIDDCHLAASPESEHLLAAVTLEMPLRVVLVSRTRPGWVTPRMIVYGEACMLEMADLAFTDEEARAVIGEGPDAAATGLLSRAHGWPAVIGLAAQRGSAEVQAKPASKDLFEFFAEDLFQRAKPELQRALILLALGGDANADIAKEVLGESHEAILTTAWEHGFLGPDAVRLEIHPLLRAFLLDRLDDLPAAAAEDIVRDTVEVLAANELWDECLAPLQQFPIAGLIASVLNESLVELLTSGRIETVKRWVDLARANHVSDPMLLLAEAEIALRDRDDRRAQMLGAQAGELLVRGDAAARAYIVAARAAHFCDNPAGVRRYADLARSRAVGAELRTAALWISFSSASEHSIAEAKSILSQLGDQIDDRPDYTVRVLSGRALLAMHDGTDARTAAENCELAGTLRSRLQDPFLTTNFLNLFAHVMVILAQYDRALTLTDELLEEANATGLDFTVDHGLLTRTSAFIGLRKLSAAKKTLKQISDRGSPSAHILRNVQFQEVRLNIASGDLEKAAILLEREPENLTRSTIGGEFFGYRGLVLSALGDEVHAEAALRMARRCKGYRGSAALSDLAGAILGLRQGDRYADAACVKALMTAYARGRLDSIVTAARAFPDLVRAGATNESCARALTQILSLSSDIDLGRQAGLQMPRALRRHETLSPRERDVYELMVLGRSNKEIAGTLFISESTAKVHVRHIYDKLGVRTRAELGRTTLDEPNH